MAFHFKTSDVNPVCDPFAGEKHNCQSHLQDRQSSSRAGLPPQTLQSGGLCGTVPEDEATWLQQASCRRVVPSTGPAAVDDGSLPAATDATLSNYLKILEGRLLFIIFFFLFNVSICVTD